MKTATISSFSFKHAICIQTLHCSVRFTICGMALELSAIIHYESRHSSIQILIKNLLHMAFKDL